MVELRVYRSLERLPSRGNPQNIVRRDTYKRQSSKENEFLSISPYIRKFLGTVPAVGLPSNLGG